MKTLTDLGHPKNDCQKNLLVQAQKLLFEITCGEIKKLLAAADIHMLVLKGPHIGSTLYDGSSERDYYDLDILVQPGHYYPAVKILLKNGFQLFSVNRRRLASEKVDYQLLMRAPRGVAVELHRALADRNQFRSDVQGFFQRAEEFIFGALKVNGLGKEDLLLHLCLHCGKRHFLTSEKKHLLDIALLLQKKNINWPVFLQRIKQAGSRVVTFYCLKAVQSQHGAEIPPEVMASLNPGPWRRRILDRYLDSTTFPIYRFHNSPPGLRDRMVNLLLLGRFSTMVSFSFRFVGRSMLNLVLRFGLLRRLWLKRYQLGEWI
jgi:hypothetical protein